MNSNHKRSVLVIDHDFQFLNLYNHLLPRSRFHLIKTSNYSEAMGFLKTIKIDLIICEVDDAESVGLELLKFKKVYGLKTPILVVSGAFYPAYAIITEEAYEFIPKIELMDRLPDLVKEDSPLWSSDTIKAT